MASQVLSGSRNVSYTNNTGQNVRIVINFMSSVRTTLPDGGAGTPSEVLSISWAGISKSYSTNERGGGEFISMAIGRNLAYSTPSSNTELVRTLLSGGLTLGTQSVPVETSFSVNNAHSSSPKSFVFPTELMLAPGQTFSATCGPYNIVVIPEAG